MASSAFPHEETTSTFKSKEISGQIYFCHRCKQETYYCSIKLGNSQLTDGFSPVIVGDGTTRRILDLLIEKTEYRIRVLTKNAIVGNRQWVRYFADHADRFVVGLSIGTLDDQFGKRLEKGTSIPSARVKALHQLQDAGVPTFGMLCPVTKSTCPSSYDRPIQEVSAGRRGEPKLQSNRT